MSRYAEVIVDLSARRVDRPFHYAIPEALASKVQVGTRVLVPFGNRSVEGYVINVVGESDIPGVKYILEVVDDLPLFSSDLVRLARWMSEHYICLFVEALQCMLPGGIRMRPIRTVRLLVHPDEAIEAAEGLKRCAPRQAQILEKLVEMNGEVRISEFEKGGRFAGGCAGLGSSMSSLSGKGLIEVVTKWKRPRAKPKVVRALRLVADLESIEEAATTLADQGSNRQAAVLKAFLRTGEMVIPASMLTRLCGAGLGAFRGLERKGLVAFCDLEVQRRPSYPGWLSSSPELELTQDQKSALSVIEEGLAAGGPRVVLVYGVTGSGKTEVYLRAIARAVGFGRQAIVLVPEISLTPQMIEWFKGKFGDSVAVLHSRLSVGERFDEWRRIRRGEASIAIGARSCVFAPFPDLGLIVVDEEHENTYKQEEVPRYHAREVALRRAKECGALVVLGSATPSIESYHRALGGEFECVILPARIDNRPLPQVEVIDMREELKQGNRTIFSQQLALGIEERLRRKEQVILFLNRRGHSTFVICRECGHALRCRACDVSLTFHAQDAVMRCHYCSHEEKVPDRCPKCGSIYIKYFGVGTEKVQAEVTRRFPGVRVARMDVDTTARQGAHARILSAFRERQVDVLVGTQMVAKGLDFPNVTLVGVIAADTSLHLPDFRSAERTFQLISQVAGRAGRGEVPGEVVVQTYSPDHYAILWARTHDYKGFFDQEILAREELGYPPFSRLMSITVRARTAREAADAARTVAASLSRKREGVRPGEEEKLRMDILGPSPAPLERVKDEYRWQVTVKARDARDAASWGQAVREAMDEIGRAFGEKVMIDVDVDPISLM